MSSINKAVFRIIGLFALLVSVIFLYVYISGFKKIITVQSFMYQIASLGIICIGIYGGLQLLKLRRIGLRLLLIWLSCQILTMIFFVFPAVVSSSLAFLGQFQIIIPAVIPNSLIAAYYLLYPVALIYLLVGKKAQESLIDDPPRHIRVLATLLSLLAPGLARALVGNPLAGMVFFYSYWLLITGSSDWQGSPESFDRILRILPYVGGWGILVAIDWYAIREFKHSERIKNSPAPDLATKQVNGG
jgi:hypothetical protein